MKSIDITEAIPTTRYVRTKQIDAECFVYEEDAGPFRVCDGRIIEVIED